MNNLDLVINKIIEEANESLKSNDVPVGSVIVQNDEIIAFGHNTREKDHSILGHAEINAIKMASSLLNRWNLADCDLYVTLKPCSMCLDIIKQSRIKNVYFLLDKLDYKKDFNGTKINKIDDIEHEQKYANLLNDFFSKKR